jgi:predicted DNA-binding transcriptional regulator AlpA
MLVERVLWPVTGFVTLKQILGKHGGPIPVAASTWWAGVQRGEFPQPVNVGGRTVWRVSDIDDLITRLGRSSVSRSRRIPPPLRRVEHQVVEK